MSEVAASVHPGAPIAVLSGPTFAHEVAVGLPTAVTLACADRTLGDAIAARLARPQFRPYLSADVIGAEIETGRAHVCTPVTIAQSVCRFLFAMNTRKTTHTT